MSSNYDVKLRAELERLITQIGGVVPVAPPITNEDERTLQLLRAVSDRMPLAIAAGGAGSSSVVISPSMPADPTKLWLKGHDGLYYFSSLANRWLSVEVRSSGLNLSPAQALTVGTPVTYLIAVPFTQLYLIELAGYLLIDPSTLNMVLNTTLHAVYAVSNSIQPQVNPTPTSSLLQTVPQSNTLRWISLSYALDTVLIPIDGGFPTSSIIRAMAIRFLPSILPSGSGSAGTLSLLNVLVFYRMIGT